MTLNLMLVAPWGIWQSSDHRLTDPQTGKPVDSYSIKHVTVACPDGTALITYTGLGSVKNTDMSDWLRGVIRGRTRSLYDTLILVRERASRWISPLAAAKHHHIFTIGAFLSGNAWAIIISNIQPAPNWPRLPPTPHFHTSAKRIEDKPIAIVTGGGRDAVAAADIQLLDKAAKRRPRNTKEFGKLLAAVNRRASEHRKYGRLITSSCVTTYMPPAGEPIETEMHGWEPGKDRAVPMVFRGIDLTDWSQVLTDQLRKVTQEKSAENTEEFQRRLREEARRAVHPKVVGSETGGNLRRVKTPT